MVNTKRESDNRWTYGAEHEWADFDKKADLQGVAKHNDKDYTIVNSNGIANDPKGKLYDRGGEINTTASNLEGQVACLKRLRAILPDATVNYRSNLHIHVRVPGLREDLTKLKRIQKYIHSHMPTLFPVIQPIEKPLLDGMEPHAYQGAIKRYKRMLVSHHYLLPKKRLEEQLAAQTVDEFFRAEVSQSKKGRALWHLQPRACVNIRQLRETDTIEFRHFFGTLDSGLLRNCLEYCRDFLQSALDEAPVNDLIEKYRGVEFPKCPKYDHRLEVGYQATCHGNSREVIERNIKLILDKQFEGSAAAKEAEAKIIGTKKAKAKGVRRIRNDVVKTLDEIVVTVRAVEEANQKSDRGLFRVGYLIIAELGPRGQSRANNNSGRKLDIIAAELARQGFPQYSKVYLRLLWSIGTIFPHDKILLCATWWAHRIAGDPDTLCDAKAEADHEGVPLTGDYVKKFKARQRRETAHKNRQKHLDGRPNNPARTLALYKVRTAVADAQARGEDARKTIKPYVNSLSALEREGLYADATNAIQVLTAFRAELVEPYQERQAAE
jgi:hypothetical protein